MSTIKFGNKTGILVYDLEDQYMAQEMEAAKNVNSIICAITDFLNKLRSIRKYDNIETVADMASMDKEAILKAEEYYRALLVQCLEENEVNDFMF